MVSSNVNTEDRDMSAVNIHVYSAVHALSTALVWQGLSFTDYLLQQKAVKQYCTPTKLPDRATSEVLMSRASYDQAFQNRFFFLRSGLCRLQNMFSISQIDMEVNYFFVELNLIHGLQRDQHA